MRHQSPSHEIKEQAALYALGILNQLEARAFESHIREGCEVCQAELFKFERAAGLFALNAPQIKPPAYLIDLLLARIEKETSEQSGSANDRNAPPGLFTRPGKGLTKVFRMIFSQVFLVRLIPWATTAALVVVAVVLLSALSAARSASSIQVETIARAKSDIAEMSEMVERATDRSRELARIVALLGTPGVRQVQLVGEGPAASARIALYLDEKKGFSIVSADQLPLAEGMVHRVWFVTPDGPKDAGALQADSAGHAFLATSVAANFSEITAACITLEPEGSDHPDHPTTRVLAIGKIVRGETPRRKSSRTVEENSGNSEPSSPNRLDPSSPVPERRTGGENR